MGLAGRCDVHLPHSTPPAQFANSSAIVAGWWRRRSSGEWWSSTTRRRRRASERRQVSTRRRISILERRRDTRERVVKHSVLVWSNAREPMAEERRTRRTRERAREGAESARESDDRRCCCWWWSLRESEGEGGERRGAQDNEIDQKAKSMRWERRQRLELELGLGRDLNHR